MIFKDNKNGFYCFGNSLEKNPTDSPTKTSSLNLLANQRCSDELLFRRKEKLCVHSHTAENTADTHSCNTVGEIVLAARTQEFALWELERTVGTGCCWLLCLCCVWTSRSKIQMWIKTSRALNFNKDVLQCLWYLASGFPYLHSFQLLFYILPDNSF